MTERHQHPGSVIIGSKQFNESYISSLITQSCEEITELSLIAKTYPQATYSALHQVTNATLHSSWELLKILKTSCYL